MKFPDLGLEENKYPLQVLLDIKYREVESAILEQRDLISQLDRDQQKIWCRAIAKLESLGALPAPDDLPF